VHHAGQSPEGANHGNRHAGSRPRDYGVVLTGELQDYSFEVDQEATQRRREALRAERERASGSEEVDQ